jgi:hypothetical protein
MRWTLATTLASASLRRNSNALSTPKRRSLYAYFLRALLRADPLDYQNRRQDNATSSKLLNGSFSKDETLWSVIATSRCPLVGSSKPA